ncbi:MAG: hypothetical protein NTW62_02205 [Candidatus Nomurabacteria bacterium]|nr:hypothetical protein [Candidatus Nomurabacteria bacterium]
MDENTKKIIKEKFDSLPESIQEVILSSNYQDTLVEIGKQNNLSLNQMGTLELEATLVMMGLTPTAEFETELTKELAVDPMKGSKIVNEINEKIFIKIRDLLKLMNTPKGEEPSLDAENERLHEESNVPFKVFTPTEKITIPVKTESLITTLQQEKESIKDNSVLETAGIEIVNQAPMRNAVPSDAGGETRNEILKSVEQPESIGKTVEKPKETSNVGSILASKLTESFKIPAGNTEYTMNNMTKDNQKTQLAASPSIPKVDPYRMPLDE